MLRIQSNTVFNVRLMCRDSPAISVLLSRSADINYCFKRHTSAELVRVNFIIVWLISGATVMFSDRRTKARALFIQTAVEGCRTMPAAGLKESSPKEVVGTINYYVRSAFPTMSTPESFSSATFPDRPSITSISPRTLSALQGSISLNYP